MKIQFLFWCLKMKVVLDHINTFYSFFSQICIALGNFNLPWWGGDLHDDDDNNIPFFIIKKTTDKSALFLCLSQSWITNAVIDGNLVALRGVFKAGVYNNCWDIQLILRPFVLSEHFKNNHETSKCEGQGSGFGVTFTQTFND